MKHDPRNSSPSHPEIHLIDERAAAARLCVAVSTLRRWRWSGKPPPFVKISVAVRYDPLVIREFIEAGRRTSTSSTGNEGA